MTKKKKCYIKNKCYTMEAKRFENKLKELNINFNDFKILTKMHEELTIAGKAEVANILTEQ